MKPVTKAVLWILVVFLAGTLFGGGMTTLLRPTAPAGSERTGDRDGDSRERRQQRPSMLDRLTSAVDLDNEQVEAVRRILRDGSQRYEEIEKALSKEKRRRRDKVRHENRDRIRALLSADQLLRFETFLEDLHREWQERSRRRQNGERGESRNE